MAPIKLKDYQLEAVEAVKKEFQAGITRQLIALPTGTGKTFIMAALATAYNQKTLILAHREELIQQALEKIKLYHPEASIGICKADLNELDHTIVVGSVQTCSQTKRLKQLKQQNFEVLLIDEAHHTASPSYQKIITALGFKNNKKLLVGVSATPERNDDLALLDTFQKITYSRSIASMISDGHLVPVFGRKILTTTSLAGVPLKQDDFAQGSLAQAINTTERNDFIVSKFSVHAAKRKAVAFCANVQHAKDLAKAFNKHGIKAAAVWGEMPLANRKKMLAKLKEGSLQVVTSCGLLTEGYDEETLSCIVMARPTRSALLYIQCIGRGLRTSKNSAHNKQDCLVLEFSDSYHQLESVMTLKTMIPTAVQHNDDRPTSRKKEKPLSSAGKAAPFVELSDKNYNLFGVADYFRILLQNVWANKNVALVAKLSCFFFIVVALIFIVLR